MATRWHFIGTRARNKKTMTFKNEGTFAKGNHSRVTVFTKVSSNKDISLRIEFIFKGNGTRTKIDVTNFLKITVSGFVYSWIKRHGQELPSLKKLTG